MSTTPAAVLAGIAAGSAWAAADDLRVGIAVFCALFAVRCWIVALLKQELGTR